MINNSEAFDSFKQERTILWHAHVYGYGAAYGLCALYSISSLIRLWKNKHLLSKNYFAVINMLVFTASTSRSVLLLVDPYNVGPLLPSLAAEILYYIIYPIIELTFSLLFLSLLTATQITFISQSLQEAKVIGFVSVIHLIITIASAVMNSCGIDNRVVQFVCRVFDIVWGLLLFVGYITVFKHLLRSSDLRETLMNKHMMRKLGLSAKQYNVHKLTLSLSVKVMLCSAAVGILSVVLIVYGMVDVYRVFTYQKYLYHCIDGDTWFAYHWVLRAMEILMLVTFAYTATLPFKLPGSGTDNTERSCYTSCSPCYSWWRKEKSYLLPEVGWNDFKSDVEIKSDVPRRGESQKGDFPLHHIRRCSQDPTSPNNLLNTPMLKADHGNLIFSGGNDELKLDTIENLHYYHSNSNLTEEATLKINRDMMDQSNDRTNLLSQSEQADNILGKSASQQSLDRVSQLTPELDSDSNDESNELLADV